MLLVGGWRLVFLRHGISVQDILHLTRESTYITTGNAMQEDELGNPELFRPQNFPMEFGIWKDGTTVFFVVAWKKISPGGTWSTSTQHLSSPRQPLSAASACTARVADFTVSGQRIPSMLTPWVQVTSCLACMERSRMIRTTRWWFQMFFIFNPGEMIQFD